MRVKPFSPNKPPGTIARDEMLAFSLRGAIGRSNHYGNSRYGISHYGDDNPMNGIYQSRPLGYNQYTGPPTTKAKKEYIKKISYRPTNPQTVQQQAWRAVFTAGVSAWQSLTDGERKNYNKRATRKSRLGFTLFMSEYLKAHR